MLFKKAFTLAEILIVLMVIGVIAAMTIPSLMRGLVDGQLKTGYKKALSVIQNITLAEKVAGFLPSTNISRETAGYFESLNKNLAVNAYVSAAASPVNSGTVVRSGAYSKAIKIVNKIYGSNDEADIAGVVSNYSITTVAPSPWIVTDDNMAYSIMCGGGTGAPARCGTVAEIVAQPNQTAAIMKSCTVVIVDVNGLSKGPNTYDPQAGGAGARLNQFNYTLDPAAPLQPLTGDQYLIFVGLDGATAGPRTTTITGRIAADLK